MSIFRLEQNPCLLLSYQHSWLLKRTEASALYIISEGVTT